MCWTVMGAAEADQEGRNLLTGYREHVPALHALVRRLLDGDLHNAEDIVQEALVRCWHKFDHSDSEWPRSWLFRVARNLVIDTRRREQARQETGSAEWIEQEPVENDAVERMLSSAVVGEALKALTPPNPRPGKQGHCVVAIDPVHLPHI
ncbi:sigma-70 family RNA polymerase sigma factor [Streptomyces sp. NBC_01483]|uniref:sigma-70 family RNA polymerase sigma factor n=1 Tax=Streptomyces sp. NBC_01483 TaxID=2903883 RepID=UPI002E324C30|nr:sigma-70 family RNA polymerase sigma factor [Streptomyces sp. NBC_01483]